MLTSDCGAVAEYALVPAASTPSDTFLQKSTNAPRQVTDAQVEAVLEPYSHASVRATAWHLADRGAKMPLIRQRVQLVHSLVAQARYRNEQGIDLREAARTGRRNAYKIAADLGEVMTADGKPHFEILGLTVCPLFPFPKPYEVRKQMVAEAMRTEARRKARRKYERSDLGKQTRRLWRQTHIEDARLLRRSKTRDRVERTVPIPAPTGRPFAPQSGVHSLHTPPAQIGPQTHSAREKHVTILSYGYSAEADQPHTPSTSIKKTKTSESYPTAPDRARMPEPCAEPELGTQLFPKCELGREPSLSTNKPHDSFASTFPDYHERMDSEADDSMAAYAEWASFESQSQARPTEPSPRHAEPVGSCGVAFKDNCLEDNGPADCEAVPTSEEPARPDWLSHSEVAQLPPESQDLWAAYTSRSYAARLRIAATLRRSHLGGPSRESKSAARPVQTAEEREREQIKRGEQILLRNYGLRKEQCVDPNELKPSAPLAKHPMEQEERLDHLMIEVGGSRAYLRWSVLDRNRIPSYLVARAALHLENKLKRGQRVHNTEAWLFSNAKQYAERGTLPNEIIGPPRPFEDDREAAETLAPKYALYHEGPGARRWS